MNIIMKFFLLSVVSLQICYASSNKIGKRVYEKNCASCHHQNRVGLSGPPLMSESIAKISDEKLESVIINGLPNTLMNGFSNLSKEELKELKTYLRSESKVSWTKKDIEDSLALTNNKNKNLKINEPLNLTTVVERGNSKVWLMENEKILDKFEFENVHGGIKYTRDYDKFFVPSRSGIIGKYSMKNGYEGSVRSCVSLRNITISNDNKYLISACLLPQQIVVMNVSDLLVKKIIPIQGKISGIYSLIEENKAIFTYRDKAEIGVFNFDNLKIKYNKLAIPIEDFFIDPLDKFLIGSSRNGERMSVVDLENFKELKSFEITGMPHLSSAAYWYDKGQFYFSTFHIKSNFVTIWKMYDWEMIKKVEVGGNGFFVKTHQNTPYLWIDNGSDEAVLVNKYDFSVKKIKPYPGKKFTHTEFSRDGKISYLSIYDKNGSLILLDSITLKEITRFDNSFPVGKYNVTNKEREFLPVNLGAAVFMGKCWGCHHQDAVAFAPTLTKIASLRNKGLIIAQLDDPKVNAANLGYTQATMPKIDLSEEEKQMVASYIMSHKKDLKPYKAYNMAEHDLKHPARDVKDCESFKTWKKLGFSAFSEEDKEKQEIYEQICN